MQPRMSNPVTILPDANEGIQALTRAAQQGGVSRTVLELVHLRTSQINGCSFCVDYGSRSLKKAGESDERLFAVAAWRDASCFTNAERAALALAEAITRIADQADPVPDVIWEEAARHYDEKGLATLVLLTSTANLFTRLSTATRQGAGAPQEEEERPPRSKAVN